jgi:DNA-binding protein HU-beta
MTKTELIDKVSSLAGITKAEAGKAIDTTLESIEVSLKKGQKVILVGFGTFSVSKRKARNGRNPGTGKEIKIPAISVPKFTAGKILRDAVM